MTMSWHHIASGCAGISIATTLFSTAAEAGSVSSIADAVTAAAGFAISGLASGYRAAPALMLGMGFLAAIPLIALASRLSQLRYATETLAARADDADFSAEVSGDTLDFPGPAFVEVIGARNARFAILRDMLRIGQEDDNDIRIPSRGVHRYHAAIHREDVSDWWITDLSGTDGKGVIVNGQKCSDARLHDGDVIELGPGRLKFHAGAASGIF